ncbi:unnamed protein product [Rotaria sordida]|uniref:LysM domain-containing protein n=1 Tax=Rotaria sordida TaxID=392033 RepID=A0A813NY64_9BILA|nr:unnamed protein product [Rotaria sordida]
MANLETSTDAAVAVTEAPKSNNLSEVAQDLMDAHAHRPGLVQEDLAKATEALHANGTLANLTVVGLDGKDLIVSNQEGQKLLLDANNPENQQVLPTDLTSQPIGDNGRTAELAADGSGKYTVVSGDSCWRVANDILTSQGLEDPTDNQIANYIKELEVANGRSFDSLQIGDEILIPTKIQGGESSQFAAPESTDTTPPTDTQETSALSPEAAKQMELEKFGVDNSFALMAKGFDKATQVYTPGGPYSSGAASLEDINNALNLDSITPDERLGLGMLQTGFDSMKNPEDGKIHLDDLARAKAELYEKIEAKYNPSSADVMPEARAEIPALLDTTSSTDTTNTADATDNTSVDPPALKSELDLIDGMFDRMGQGYLKAAEHPESNFTSSSVTLEDISNTLTRTDLSDEERHGLRFMESNFDDLKNPETGTISSHDLYLSKEKLIAEARANYADAAAAADPNLVVPELTESTTSDVPTSAPVIERDLQQVPALDPAIDPALKSELDSTLNPALQPSNFETLDFTMPSFSDYDIYSGYSLMSPAA